VAQAFPGCVALVAPTHIHASWRGWARTTMTASGSGQWRATFQDVPRRSDLAIRINDPNLCDESTYGAATAGIRANGRMLSRVVPTPVTEDGGNGLTFGIGPNGQIVP
jgi:hypothetical protein